MKIPRIKTPHTYTEREKIGNEWNVEDGKKSHSTKRLLCLYLSPSLSLSFLRFFSIDSMIEAESKVCVQCSMVEYGRKHLFPACASLRFPSSRYPFNFFCHSRRYRFLSTVFSLLGCNRFVTNSLNVPRFFAFAQAERRRCHWHSFCSRGYGSVRWVPTILHRCHAHLRCAR